MDSGCVLSYLFPVTEGEGGKRIWEAISDPFYAKSEEALKVQDVNLFSLCRIKITADNGQGKTTHLNIDFSQIDIPKFVKINKDEVVSSILRCIIYSTQFPPHQKPSISLVGKLEDKDLLDQASKQYEKASQESTDFDFSKPYHPTITHPTLAEQLDIKSSNIIANTVLADVSNNADDKIIVRDLRIKPYTALHDRHYYRFEFYSSGVLQNCDTFWDMSEPGKVTATWRGNDVCNISLIDGWLQVTFERDKLPHWAFSRRVD